MPHPILKTLRQVAVVWEPDPRGVDRRGELRILDTPYEIKCRWLDQSSMGTTPQGDQIQLSATVYVDRDIPANSLMMLGSKKDLPPQLDLGDQNLGDTSIRIMQVRTKSNTPTLKARRTAYQVGLVWFRNTLPDSAE